MKEFRLVVSEKIVFVSGDESKLIAQFGITGLSQFYFHDSRNPKIISESNSPLKFWWRDWAFDGTFRPVVEENFENEYRDESKSLAQLESSGYPDSEARLRLNDYLYETHWTIFKHLIDTLTEKITL